MNFDAASVNIWLLNKFKANLMLIFRNKNSHFRAVWLLPVKSAFDIYTDASTLCILFPCLVYIVIENPKKGFELAIDFLHKSDTDQPSAQ